MIVNAVIGLIGFSILVFLQALFINGLKETMKEGMILQWVPKFIKWSIKNEFFHRPMFSCIQCMSGPFGQITFWATILPLFGFNYKEIFISIADCFILVFINGWIYKKI